jgi:hypothetical protein
LKKVSIDIDMASRHFHHTSTCSPLLMARHTVPAVEAVECVQLSLRIETRDALSVRRALHAALGSTVDIYVMKVNHARGTVLLSLRTTRDGVDALMHAIMRDLPGAEFGRVQSTSRAATH